MPIKENIYARNFKTEKEQKTTEFMSVEDLSIYNKAFTKEELELIKQKVSNMTNSLISEKNKFHVQENMLRMRKIIAKKRSI